MTFGSALLRKHVQLVQPKRLDNAVEYWRLDEVHSVSMQCCVQALAIALLPTAAFFQFLYYTDAAALLAVLVALWVRYIGTYNKA